MIGSKVVLTYKRKRFSSRPGLGFENECPDQPPGCQTLEILKAPIKEEEDSIHESERRDPEFAVCNGDSNMVQCEYCHYFHNVQGLLPSNEHLDGKKLCSTCVKQQDRLSAMEAVGNSCEDTMKVKKPAFPLITFSRRSRHKKKVDGSGMQEKSTVVEKYDFVAVKSNSTTDNGCLQDLSTDLTGNDLNLRYCAASQEKTGEDADLRDVDSLSVPKIEIEKETNEELTTGRCTSKDTTLIAEASGKSPMDAISSVKNKQADVSQSHVSAADESEIILSNVLESAKITNDKKRDESSLASFDLSKPPPESSCLVDCNLTLESSCNVQIDNNISENHRDSTESTSSTVLHEFPSQGRVLDLLDERIGETSLSRVHCVPARQSNSSHVWAHELPSVSTGQSQTSKKNFLQLFPEDRLNDTLPLKNPIQETSLMHLQDWPSILSSNGKHLHFRSSTSSPASINFNLSPPIEPRNREPVHGLIGPQYPSDPVSLMRHKMMLDNIISKARAVSSKKSNFTDNFDFPNVWSEDELDFLWIGVRRHGVGSWDSILRDPRLHFSSWRSPRELAEQWEEEQLKLLSPNPPSQTKRYKPTKKYNPNLVEEPQLSLGFRGRSTFESLVNGPTVAINGNLNPNLPHWLREAASFPPSRPVGPTAIPSVSYTGHSGLMQWISQPFSGSNRTTGMMNKMAPELQPPLVQPAAAHSISKPDEVIIINSDASSEETISDNRSVRN